MPDSVAIMEPLDADRQAGNEQGDVDDEAKEMERRRFVAQRRQP